MFNAPVGRERATTSLLRSVQRTVSSSEMTPCSLHGFKGVWCLRREKAVIIWGGGVRRLAAPPVQQVNPPSADWRPCDPSPTNTAANVHIFQVFAKLAFSFISNCFTEMSWKENDVTKNKCKKLHWLKTGWGVKWSVNEVCASVHLVFSWWLSENLHLMSDVQSRTFQEQLRGKLKEAQAPQKN